MERAQRLVRQDLKIKGFQSVWGDPVPAHVSSKTGLDTLRGYAAGVAIMSSLPLHYPSVPLRPEVLSTNRLVEGSLRIGHMQLRVICMYGFPSAYADHRQRNQSLLQMVLERIVHSQMPTLIGGDLNCMVQELPAWQALLHLGYVEYFEFHKARFNQVLPATCRGVTRHDTLLLPPCLQSLVVGAEVDVKSRRFDTHDPLVVHLSCAHAAPTWIWRMPKPWTTFGPDMDWAVQHYTANQAHVQDAISCCSCPEDVSAAFSLWADALEHSVDAAIRHGHRVDPVAQPHTSLPRAARGRCRERTRVARLATHVARRGRDGDYNPTLEAATIASRRRVRQVRRLQTLLRGLVALSSRQGQAALQLRKQLSGEWAAARKSRAFGPPSTSGCSVLSRSVMFGLICPQSRGSRM